MYRLIRTVREHILVVREHILHLLHAAAIEIVNQRALPGPRIANHLDTHNMCAQRERGCAERESVYRERERERESQYACIYYKERLMRRLGTHIRTHIHI